MMMIAMVILMSCDQIDPLPKKGMSALFVAMFSAKSNIVAEKLRGPASLESTGCARYFHYNDDSESMAIVTIKF